MPQKKKKSCKKNSTVDHAQVRMTKLYSILKSLKRVKMYLCKYLWNTKSEVSYFLNVFLHFKLKYYNGIKHF